LNYWRLDARRPGLLGRRFPAEPAFIDKDNRAPFLLGLRTEAGPIFPLLGLDLFLVPLPGLALGLLRAPPRPLEQSPYLGAGSLLSRQLAYEFAYAAQGPEFILIALPHAAIGKFANDCRDFFITELLLRPVRVFSEIRAMKITTPQFYRNVKLFWKDQ